MAETELPFVSVIVPARNCERTIDQCISSILATDYPQERREIVVVDNASTDSSRERISRFPVRCLSEDVRGASAARNRGITSSSGEIVAFIDADCVATTGWLRRLVAGFSEDDIWGVAGEILAFPPQTPVQRYTAMRKETWQKSAMSLSRPFAVTANVAFRRRTFERVGLFDPTLIKAQDKDFGWRFFNEGDLKLAYSAGALVLHQHRSTAWTHFLQHAGWGYGASLLHRKYDLPWGVRLEAAKHWQLLQAASTALTTRTRSILGKTDELTAANAGFEFLRQLGLRVGALYGLVLGWMRGPRRGDRA